MALTVMWRTKQLQYSLLRTMMNRYKDFWQVTQDGLVYSAKALKLDLTADKQKRLMDAYMMLQAATRSAGIAELLDAVISVDEIKLFKPNPRVYALASAHLKAPNANIGF